jgi:hypothetical protein
MAIRRVTTEEPTPQFEALLVSGEVISTEEIARRAYEIYESRGRTEGSDLDDWLQAERELRQEPVVTRRAAAGVAAD